MGNDNGERAYWQNTAALESIARDGHKTDLEKLERVFDQIGVKYKISHWEETDRTDDHYELYLSHYVFFFDKDGKFKDNAVSGVV